MFFLGYHAAKTALIYKEKNSISVAQLGDHVNPLYNDPEIVTGLEAREVLMRQLKLKLKSKREILAALPFQVEHLLPYSQEEMILLPTLYPKEGETDVCLQATSQSTLERHLIDLNSMSIDPDIVSSVPLALYRFARHFVPQHSSLFVYHCDEEEHIFIVIKDEKLYASQVQRTEDLDRMCAYMQKKFPEITAVLHTGIDNLPTPFVPIEFDQPELVEHAIPIGLALDAAKGDQQSGQFRQVSLSKKGMKRGQKAVFTFLGACAVFICAALVLGHLHLHKLEKSALAAIGGPPNGSLKEIALQLATQAQGAKKSTLRISSIPKVHEVLAWLSCHPAFAEESSITRLRYDLVDTPKLGSNVNTTTATLELELAMPSARAARAFHEALLSDRKMVDQKHPVKWSGDHGIYQAKFNIKSRQSK